MKNVGAGIRNSMIKRQAALERFRARKIAFLTAREEITKEIEEARTIWEETLKQLPNLPF